MPARKSNPKKNLLIIPVFLLIAGLIGGLVCFYQKNKDTSSTAPSDPTPSKTAETEEDKDLLHYNGGLYRLNEKIETILVMGIDQFSDNTGTEAEGGSVNHQQADFLLLLIFDTEKETCTPVQINRDTMCSIWLLDINGDPYAQKNGQISRAHAYGSGG